MTSNADVDNDNVTYAIQNGAGLFMMGEEEDERGHCYDRLRAIEWSTGIDRFRIFPTFTM